MTDGHLASFGFGHPNYMTDLDEFSIDSIESAFRIAFKDDPELEEKWREFFSRLDPYSDKYWRYERE